jgi:hypothetical protein
VPRHAGGDLAEAVQHRADRRRRRCGPITRTHHRDAHLADAAGRLHRDRQTQRTVADHDDIDLP